MTDATTGGLVAVSPTLNGGVPEVQMLAAVALVSEVPPVAGNASIAGLAIVSLSKEYQIPISYIPFSAGAFFQTMPYYIGQ